MKIKLPILLLFVLMNLASLAQPWFQKASFGGAGRHRSVGIAIGNKGYIGTGHVNGTGVDISYKDWWQYDPASDSWTQKADFPVNGHGVTAWGTETRGYVLSGTNIAEYDPATNAWTLKAPCPISINTWSSAFGTSSSGFVKSGVNLYEFKPYQNEWIQRANFPGLCSNGSSAFSIDGKGYITCGYVGGLSTVTDQVWEFNSGSNSWTLIGEFPGTSRRFPVAFAIEGKGYFGTGTNGINMNDFWQFNYNPLGTDELILDETTVQAFPNPASDEVTFAFNNVDYSKLENCKVSIYNLQGELIEERTNLTPLVKIERNSKMNGMYIYTISTTEKSMYTGKLIYN